MWRLVNTHPGGVPRCSPPRGIPCWVGTIIDRRLDGVIGCVDPQASGPGEDHLPRLDAVLMPGCAERAPNRSNTILSDRDAVRAR